MSLWTSNWNRVLLGLLMGVAFFTPLGIVPLQLFAYAALGLGALLAGTRRDRAWRRHALWLPLMIFLAVVLVVSAWGESPAHSFKKMPRLLLLLLTCVIPMALARAKAPVAREGWPLLLAFLAGSSLLGLLDVMRAPWEWLRGTTLFDFGNMRDPQFYATALVALTALGCCRRAPAPLSGGAAGDVSVPQRWAGFWRWLCAPRQQVWLLRAAVALNLSGLILHFKRGAWFACLLSVMLVTVLAGRKRLLWAVAALVILLVALPQTRERLQQVWSQECSIQDGRRMALWTRVAPALIATYPCGRGYATTQYGDFLHYGVIFRQMHNHLHSNVLQIALELGPVGLAAWLVWMGLALTGVYAAWRTHGARDGGVRLAIFGALCALLLNGVVEYNFGDTEILTLYALLCGMAAAVMSSNTPSTESPRPSL